MGLRHLDSKNLAPRDETVSLRSHHLWATFVAAEELYRYDVDDFLRIMKGAVDSAGLTVVDQVAAKLEPQGISAVVLLAESHVALHFWPERARVTVDIHVCDFTADNLSKAFRLAELMSFTTSEKWREMWSYQVSAG